MDLAERLTLSRRDYPYREITVRGTPWAVMGSRYLLGWRCLTSSSNCSRPNVSRPVHSESGYSTCVSAEPMTGLAWSAWLRSSNSTGGCTSRIIPTPVTTATVAAMQSPAMLRARPVHPGKRRVQHTARSLLV
jgi:hypothetical protein